MDGLASDYVDIRILPKNEGMLALKMNGEFVTGKTVTVNVLQTLTMTGWTLSVPGRPGKM